MTNTAKSYILMTAFVGLLALAGLVMTTTNSSTEGANFIILPAFEDTLTAKTGRLNTDYATYDLGWELGEITYQECLAKTPYEESTFCCKRLCVTACNDPVNDLCSEKCSNVCQNKVSKMMGIRLQTR